MTKIEIINEIVAHFSKNPRSLVTRIMVGDTCAYNGKKGTHCAVGRCLLTKYKKLGRKLKGNTITIDGLMADNNNTLDDMLSPKYRGHNKYFWSDLQSLHDKKEYWVDNGLSDEGEDYKNVLLETYK